MTTPIALLIGWLIAMLSVTGGAALCYIFTHGFPSITRIRRPIAPHNPLEEVLAHEEVITLKPPPAATTDAAFDHDAAAKYAEYQRMMDERSMNGENAGMLQA